MMIKDPKLEKERLIQSTEKYKEDFENELSELTSKVERGILTGLVVGGFALLTYKIIKSLSKEEDETPQPSDQNQASTDSSLRKVGQYVAQTAALILVNLAKEKLIEYLDERKHQQEPDSSEDN